MSGVPLQEQSKSGVRALALAGRKTVANSTQVVPLRRIHKIQGASLFKESAMRLRGAAIATSDYEL
eukprot:4733594-Karenia_brevis.AAC.1